jgi:homoserine dehydrogenase
VLSALSGVLGENNISIAQAVQKQDNGEKSVPVVFFTHQALMRDVSRALDEISSFDFINAPTVHYRIIK